MKKILVLAGLVGLLNTTQMVFGATTIGSTFTLTTVSSVGPGIGSPSRPDYFLNSTNQLRTNGPYGDNSTDPEAYEVAAANIPAQAFISSSFASWMGLANPTGAFMAERGNVLASLIKIERTVPGVGSFVASDVSYSRSSTALAGLNTTGSLTGNFSNAFVGVALDGVTLYTTGASAGVPLSAVYAILYRVSLGTSGVGTEQQQLDAVKNQINAYPSGIDVTSTYTLGGTSVSNLTIVGVPEPSTALLGAVALGGLFIRRRRHA